MMLALTFALLTAPDLASAAPDPATALVVDLSEHAGAMHRRIAVSADASVGASEKAAVEEALVRTGMFELATADASATLRLSRTDQAEVRAELVDAAGQRLWQREVAWPRQPEIATSSGPREERLAEYHMRALSIRKLPLDPLDPTPKAPMFHSSWQILRGGSEVIDDVTFAQVIGDPALELRLREERDSSRLAWRLGLGGVALASIGGGVALHTQRDRDLKTFGTSLLIVGGACAILALIVPELTEGYRLEVGDAAHRAAAYNRALRAELDLAPSEVGDSPP